MPSCRPGKKKQMALVKLRTLLLRAHGLHSPDVAQGFSSVAVGLGVRNVDLHVQLLAPDGVPLRRREMRGHGLDWHRLRYRKLVYKVCPFLRR